MEQTPVENLLDDSLWARLLFNSDTFKLPEEFKMFTKSEISLESEQIIN